MTHTRKIVILSLFSLVSSVCALVLWTSVIAYYLTRGQESLPPRPSRYWEVRAPNALHSSALQGSVFRMYVPQDRLPEISPPVKLALIPGPYYKEPTSLEVALDTVPSASSSDAMALSTNEGVSTLAQWGIRRVYQLSIPSIAVRTSVLLPSRTFWDDRKWDLLEDQMQVGLNYGAVLYPHSKEPGEKGSIIIAGHSSPPTAEAEESAFGHLLARLPEMQHGDTVSLLSQGKSFDYTVREKRIVSPYQTSILKQSGDESTLVLITCYPVGTTALRLAVIADLSDTE